MSAYPVHPLSPSGSPPPARAPVPAARFEPFPARADPPEAQANKATGTPSASEDRAKRDSFRSSSRALSLGFFLFGLLNNCSYVVMLSAAKDIGGADGLVSTVLLAADAPALLAALLAPLLAGRVSYGAKVSTLVALSVAAYVGVAAASSPAARLAGVMLVSVCFGLGESTFLPLASTLTRGKEDALLTAYGSGTGGAGLAGSGLYFLLTAVAGVSPAAALTCFSVMPPVLFYAYWGLVHPNTAAVAPAPGKASPRSEALRPAHSVGEKLRYTRRLVPFFGPLFATYLVTFVMNHALLPYTRFEDGAAHYTGYFLTYQTGVFLSRSSLGLFKVRALWALPAAQALIFCAFLAHAVPGWPGAGVLAVRSLPAALALVFAAGLVCGAAYVNTFHQVQSRVEYDYREFAMGIVSSATTSGPLAAALLGMPLERALQRAAASAAGGL